MKSKKISVISILTFLFALPSLFTFQNCSRLDSNRYSPASVMNNPSYLASLKTQQEQSESLSVQHQKQFSVKAKVQLAPTDITTKSLYEMVYLIDKVESETPRTQGLDPQKIKFITIGISKTPSQRKANEEFLMQMYSGGNGG